ncbi:MAG: hypothetical protein OEZ32_01340 [Nitrospinota bacterium]|nr:hypothetical protein [Nitrospinota bacterium]
MLTCGRVLLSSLVLLLSLQAASASDPYEERRVKAGVKFFQAMLAADLDIESKKGEDGALLVIVAYKVDGPAADNIATQLGISDKGRASASIRKIPIRIEVTNDMTFQKYADRRVAGVFIGENMGKGGLDPIIGYGSEKGVLVFSPYSGHVESGVLGGISVEAYVLPFVNMKTLSKSGVRLKPFFMGVVKRYE